MGKSLSVGSILGRTATLIGRDWVIVLVLLVALAAPFALGDLHRFQGLVLVIIEFFVLRRACRRAGLLVESGPSRFFSDDPGGAFNMKPGGVWSFIGLYLFTGIPIAIGCALLIVPGLYLAARLSASGGYVIVEKRPFDTAMRDSWRATQRGALPIAIACVVLSVPALFGFGLLVACHDATGATRALVEAAASLAAFVAVIAGWYFGIAVYALVRDDAPAAVEGSDT